MFHRKVSRGAFLAQSALAMTAMSTFPRLAEGASRPEDAPVKLTYAYAGNLQKDLPLVQNAINAILVKKINATAKLNLLSWGVYDQKMKLAFATGQAGDIIFTAPWINNYYQLVANGDLLPLDELLPNCAP